MSRCTGCRKAAHSALPQCGYDNFTFFCAVHTLRNISYLFEAALIRPVIPLANQPDAFQNQRWFKIHLQR
jgi:hypothetical protein